MENYLAVRRRVYIACRVIFTGKDAQLRKRKKIRELVERHKTSLGLLIKDTNIDVVVAIPRNILEKRIFESELMAKVGTNNAGGGLSNG